MSQDRKNNVTARFVMEWALLPWRARLLLTVYMLIGAGGGLVGSEMVLEKFSHSWIAWALSLIILEPVGLACLLGLIVLMFPRSRLAGWFSHALARAKIAAIIVGLLFASGLLGSLSFLLYQFCKTL